MTYNSSEWISDCISGIEKQGDIIEQIVVIDNNSTDNTISQLKTLNSKSSVEIKILPQNENLGYAAACNIGIKYAAKKGYDCVLIMNPDVVLRANCLAEMLDVLRENPELGPVSPLHTNKEETLIERVCLWMLTNSSDFPEHFKSLDDLKKCYRTDFIIGAIMLISKRCISAVGGFDECFFFYGEDNDYCRKSLALGFTPAIAVHARAYHWHASRHALDGFRRSNKRQADYLLRLKYIDKPFFWCLAAMFYLFFKDMASSDRKDQVRILAKDMFTCLRKMPAILKSRSAEKKMLNRSHNTTE